MAKFKEILAELRKDRGLSQKELANAFHVSGSTISIAIQEIIKEYQRQKTNQRSRKGGSARKPQQYHAEAEVII